MKEQTAIHENTSTTSRSRQNCWSAPMSVHAG